jgi:uncharacterized RDD family membrane protein YckC
MTRSPRRPSRGSFKDPGDDDDKVESRQGEAGSRLRDSSSSKQSLIERFNQWLAAKRADAAIEPTRIDFSKRLIALGIDFGAGFILQLIVSLIPVLNMFIKGTLVIVLFLFVRDKLFGGRGIGKNFMGLRVVDIRTGEAPSLKQILIRNATYLGPVILVELVSRILQVIPVPALNTIISQALGLVCTVYELVILPLEIYRTYSREDSMRLGDELAGTCVTEADMSFSNQD